MARILVVDDERHVTYVIALFLTKRGHAVTRAGDGRAALELLRTEPFDVLITDVSMPKMDGLSLIGNRDDIDRLSGVILLTGRSDFDNIAWAAQGKHRMRTIPKPFNPADVADAVADLTSSATAMTQT